MCVELEKGQQSPRPTPRRLLLCSAGACLAHPLPTAGTAAGGEEAQGGRLGPRQVQPLRAAPRLVQHKGAGRRALSIADRGRRRQQEHDEQLERGGFERDAGRPIEILRQPPRVVPLRAALQGWHRLRRQVHGGGPGSRRPSPRCPVCSGSCRATRAGWRSRRSPTSSASTSSASSSPRTPSSRRTTARSLSSGCRASPATTSST